MVDDALDEVEQSPSQKEAADEELVRPQQVLPVSCPPQDEQADHNEDVGRAVKNTIPECV